MADSETDLEPIEFGFDDTDRERWAAAAAAAVAAAALRIRKRMAANIGATIPAPDAVFQSKWWDDELDTSIRAEFEKIAGEAAAHTHEAVGAGKISDALRDAVASGVAAGIIGVMGGRGAIVSDRVQTLVDRETERATADVERGMDASEAQSAAATRLTDGLGLQDNGTAEASGPISEALTAEFGDAAATGIVELSGLQTLLQSGYTGIKRWRASFINTRESHADADGQEVALDEWFSLVNPVYGESLAQAPFDPELPEWEVCGCRCWLEYELSAPGDETTVDGEPPPDEELALVASANRTPSVHGVWRGRHRTWAIRNRKGAQRLIANHAAAFVDAIPMPIAPDGAATPDHSDGVCITLEPTPAEKQMLAVPDGTPVSELHVTLCYLGTIDQFDGDASRQTLGAVLAGLADVTRPMEASVAGAGYFGEGDSAAAILLIDGDGMAVFRQTLYDALVAAGIPPSTDHDAWIPHLTIGQGTDITAAPIGMPLHFNELRLRWGQEVLAFDLLGPIAQPPESPAVPSEVAPPPAEVPMPETQPAAASIQLADGEPAGSPAPAPTAPPLDDVTTDLPPPDLSTIGDDDLVAEMAARLADAAVVEAGQLGAEVDPAVVAGLHADAEAAVLAALSEVGAGLTEEASGLDNMPDGADDLPQTPVIPVPASYTLTDPMTFPAGTPIATARQVLANAMHSTTGGTGTMTHTQVTYAIDLTGATDEEIAAEMARRAADQAITQLTTPSFTPTADDVAAAQAAASAEAAEAMIDLVDAAADAVVGDGAADVNDAGGPGNVGDVMMPAASNRRTVQMDLSTMRLIPRNEWDINEPLTDETTFPATGRPFAVEGNPPPPEGIVYDFEGIACVEGVPTDDGRIMGEGSILWRQLPLPLAFLDRITSAHQEGAFCGTIHAFERRGNAIWMMGTLADNEAGGKLRAILSDPKGAGRYGVSVDIGAATVVYASSDGTVMDEMEAEDAYYGGEKIMEMMTEGTIIGVTAVMHPALQEANVWLCGPQPVIGTEDPPAIAASFGGTVWHTMRSGGLLPYGSDGVGALVASAGGDVQPAPRKDCFDLKPDSSEAFMVHAPDADGVIRVYGLVAKWGDCHIGFEGRCVTVPKSNDFSKFYAEPGRWQKFYGGPALSRFYAGNKCVLTREGEMVQVGPLILNTVHPNLARQASDTQPFYAHTGSAVADVRLYTNEHGIVAAGCIRADADPLAVRALRASDVSPDWRYIGGELKVLALLAVPVSGFQIEGIAASAGQFKPWASVDESTGEVMALVAAGAIHRERPQGRFTSDDIALLTATVERQSEQIATLAAQVEALSVPINRDRAAKAMRVLALEPVNGAACGCGTS